MASQKKVIILACIFLALFSVLPIVQAQSNETNDSISSLDSVDERARACIEDIVDDRSCSSLGLEDKAFTVASTGRCKSSLVDDATNSECFGSNACTVKGTAQASLALDNAGKNVENYTNWISNHNMTTSDLNWFLQVDSNQQTTCSIRDLDGNNYQVGINSEKQLSLNNNQDCLSVSDNGYWLEVDSSCYNQEFEISCQDSFSTNLLFSRDDSDTVYVTDQIQTSSAGGATVEEMQKSLCMSSSGNSCSYEDTLWGVLALEDLGKNASEYYPYLTAFAEDNEDLLPESFLYQLTGDKNYRSELILKQKADSYWRETDNRYYDTAVALMALSDENPEAKSNALSWLEDEQGQDGCWNDGSLRDTGFLVHSIWPESQGSKDKDEDKDPIDGGGGGKQNCEAEGHYCVSGIKCNEAGGDVLEAFSCSSFGDRCCTEEPEQNSCSDLGGEICSSSETCSGSTEPNASGLSVGQTCCVGTCEPEEDPEPSCSEEGGVCKSQCGSNEYESSTGVCSASGQVCCMQSTTSNEGGVPWWIWVLVFLILVVVLAIMFKEKLKQFYMKYFSKKGSGGSSGKPSGPRKPPQGPPGPGRPPQGPPGPKKAPPQKPTTKVIEKKRGRNPPSPGKKKEIDDVLGKLKKIGK